METKIGVGQSVDADSYKAVREAAKLAQESAKIADCTLAIVFATGKHDPVAIRDGLHSVVGKKVRIIGGSTAGIITNDSLGYGPTHVGLALLSSDSI